MRRNALKGLTAMVFAVSASLVVVPPTAHAQAAKAKADLVLVDARDKKAVRNVNYVLTLYQMMINENKAEEGTAKLLVPDYIQHNALIGDGSAALGKYFAGVKAKHPSAHVVYKMNAEGKAVEHWDTLQLVGDDKNAAPWVGPNIPRADPNGIF